MSQSYANPGGSGNRLRAQTNATGTGNVVHMLDGSYATQSTFPGSWFWDSGLTTVHITFDFQTPRLVTEALWQQSNSTTHGDFKWQGSQDDSSYTDIGSSFTLGGASDQYHTELNGNSTAYRYYRLMQVSGSTSNNPWLHEICFKVCDGTGAGATSYSNPGGSGDRIGISTTANTGGGVIYNLLDGSMSTSTTPPGSWFMNSGQTSKRFDFDFLVPRLITEAKWYQDTNISHGDWKWQGRNNGDQFFTDIGSSFTLGTAIGAQTLTELNGNTTPYRFYRLQQVSGSTSNGPFIEEIEFKIDDGTGVQAPAGDPYFANTVLLMGFEGAAGNTTFPDESSAARGNATVVNGVVSDTFAHKGGRASAHYNNSDKLSYADSADWDLGSGNYTIECTVRPASTSFAFLVGQWQGSGSQGWVLCFDNTGPSLAYSTTGSDTVFVSASASISTGVDYDFCVDYDGTKIRVYVNGVMLGSSTVSPTIFNTSQTLNIGSNTLNNAFTYSGNLDELRITKGVARYANDSGYEPTVGAFPRSAAVTESDISASPALGISMAATVSKTLTVSASFAMGFSQATTVAATAGLAATAALGFNAAATLTRELDITVNYNMGFNESAAFVASITAAPALGVSMAASLTRIANTSASNGLGISMAATLDLVKTFAVNFGLGFNEAVTISYPVFVAATPGMGITMRVRLGSKKHQPVVNVTN